MGSSKLTTPLKLHEMSENQKHFSDIAQFFVSTRLLVSSRAKMQLENHFGTITVTRLVQPLLVTNVFGAAFWLYHEPL